MLQSLLQNLRSVRVPAPLAVLAAALLPAGAFAALLSLTAATAPRFFPAEEPAPSPFVVARAEGTVAGACQIAAVVVDDGVARADASLTLARVDTDGSADVWRAITDERGAHRFLDLPVGTYHLTALVDDRAPAAAPEWRCTGTSERAFFTLPLVASEHVLAGKVTSMGGRPAPGAELAIAQESDVRTALAGTARIPVAADGAFTTRLAPGRYVVLVQAPNHAPRVRKLTVDEAARATFAIELRPAPRVRGRVVDETGAPVPHALVALAGSFDPKQRVPSATADAAGMFSLPVTLGQDVVVTARGNGRVAQAALGVARDPLGFSNVQLVATAGRAVAGTVSRPDGSAWAYGSVRYRVRALGLSGLQQVDGEGRFVLAGMPADADVEVWADGNATGAWGAQVASPGNDVLALVYVAPAY